VYHPHSPFFDQELPVTRHMKHSGCRQFEVALGSERQLVPEWMTDEEYCRAMQDGTPQCSVEALLAVMGRVKAIEGRAK